MFLTMKTKTLANSGLSKIRQMCLLGRKARIRRLIIDIIIPRSELAIGKALFAQRDRIFLPQKESPSAAPLFWGGERPFSAVGAKKSFAAPTYTIRHTTSYVSKAFLCKK